MPDVSRVEYDAALKRVEVERICHAERRCGPIPAKCQCKRLTLAALGLDEPPTEEPQHNHDARGVYPNCPACGTGIDGGTPA